MVLAVVLAVVMAIVIVLAAGGLIAAGVEQHPLNEYKQAMALLFSQANVGYQSFDKKTCVKRSGLANPWRYDACDNNGYVIGHAVEECQQQMKLLARMVYGEAYSNDRHDLTECTDGMFLPTYDAGGLGTLLLSGGIDATTTYTNELNGLDAHLILVFKGMSEAMDASASPGFGVYSGLEATVTLLINSRSDPTLEALWHGGAANGSLVVIDGAIDSSRADQFALRVMQPNITGDGWLNENHQVNLLQDIKVNFSDRMGVKLGTDDVPSTFTFKRVEAHKMMDTQTAFNPVVEVSMSDEVNDRDIVFQIRPERVKWLY